MPRLLLALLTCCSLPTLAFAQPPFQLDGPLTFGSQEQAGPIEISAKLVPVDESTVDLRVTVNLPSHHYIYSTNAKLANATKLSITPAGAEVELVGQIQADRKPEAVNDQYQGPLEKFYDTVTWTRRMRSKGGALPADFSISGTVDGLYCGSGDGGTCTPIRGETFKASMPAGHKPAAPTETVTPEPEVIAGSSVVVIPKILGTNSAEPPIRFTVSVTPEKPAAGDPVLITVRADIADGFHTFSMTPVADGAPAMPTEIYLDKVEGLEEVDKIFQSKTRPDLETVSGHKLELHHGSVEWTREYVMFGDAVDVEGVIVFQVCNDRSCYPSKAEFHIATSAAGGDLVASTPVDADIAPENSGIGSQASLIPFILSAMGAGFLALLTPCVFPMIPVTVSYFLKQGEERPGSTLKLAVVYCLSIIGAFTILGLVAAITFGPEVLNQVATNPWLNVFFAIVFTGFALMLLGMFDVQIPSWLLTWTSKKQQTGGYLGVVFMALTFTLVSFTCTFAFVGNVLALAASGAGYLRPIIGMAAFSAAFASPFFVLALFPSMLKKLPKSGGWMNRVKVTLGLAELAIVAKFLSVADIGFSPTGEPLYLDYHLVMSWWIAVAVTMGLYLLGQFSMPHDTKIETIGPISCLFSLSMFGLAAYMTVGLFSPQQPNGGLWDQIVAFAPPTLDASVGENGYIVTHDGLEYSLEFDRAVETASKENKPLFLDFTGVNCANCRLMEKGVLAEDDVHDTLKTLVRAQLYADSVPGVKKDSEDENRILDRNHTLQNEWLKDASLPVYVIATPDGKHMLATYRGLDSTGEEFRQFLAAGLERWEAVKKAAEAEAEVATN